LGDYLKLSGIFATIAYGIALRYYERSWITLSIAEDVNRFWDVAALLANGLVFFMVGAGLQIARVAYEPVFAVACVAGVAVARFVVAGMLLPFPYRAIGSMLCASPECAEHFRLRSRSRFRLQLLIAKRSSTARLPSR